MKAIKENLTNELWQRDGATSAPSIREVDEFHEELSAAEKRKRTAERELRLLEAAGPKQKFQLTSRKSETVN